METKTNKVKIKAENKQIRYEKKTERLNNNKMIKNAKGKYIQTKIRNGKK